jgi:hypothetical protein
MMMEAIRSHEMSVLTKATQHNITEDSNLHSHRREILKYYKYAAFPLLSVYFKNLHIGFHQTCRTYSA